MTDCEQAQHRTIIESELADQSLFCCQSQQYRITDYITIIGHIYIFIYSNIYCDIFHHVGLCAHIHLYVTLLFGKSTHSACIGASVDVGTMCTLPC